MAQSKIGSYHHGQLRRALLDAAMQLIQERGVNAITLREVARQAGVSHAAPYHHFADKSALVEALVVESYGRFGEALRSGYNETDGTSMERFVRTGIAYVHFALAEPASFRLMFRPELWQHEVNDDGSIREMSPEVEAASMSAFNVLLEAITNCQKEGYIQAGDPTPVALTVWTAMHGLSMLILDGGLRKLPQFRDANPETLAMTVGQVLALGVLAR